MNFPFTIELVDPGEKCHLYTIRIDDDKLTEFEKFLSNKDVKTHREFNGLIARIDYISKKTGAQDQFFKLGEGKYDDAVVALWRNNLRLYCCRLGNIILIVGGGRNKEHKNLSRG